LVVAVRLVMIAICRCNLTHNNNQNLRTTTNNNKVATRTTTTTTRLRNHPARIFIKQATVNLEIGAISRTRVMGSSNNNNNHPLLVAAAWMVGVGINHRANHLARIFNKLESVNLEIVVISHMMPVVAMVAMVEMWV
jgi:aspartokinase